MTFYIIHTAIGFIRPNTHWASRSRHIDDCELWLYCPHGKLLSVGRSEEDFVFIFSAVLTSCTDEGDTWHDEQHQISLSLL